MEELTNLIQEGVEIALSKIKEKHDLKALVHFGSSLNPEALREESDIDLLAIVGKKPKRRIETIDKIEVTGNGHSIDVNVHFYTEDDFRKSVAEGAPVVLMALNFGNFVHDQSKILEDCKGIAKPTNFTAETWYDNGKRVYSLALMGY